MVPPGIPGSPDGRLPAAVRPGRGARAPRRGRLRGRRGARPRLVHRQRRRLRRGDRRDARGEPRRHDRLRDDGLRDLPGPAGHGSARLVEHLVGRRLPGPERLPRRPARHRARPRTRAAGRNADFDAADRRRGVGGEPRATPTAAYDRAEGDRPRPGPRRARLLRHLVVARPRRPARRDPERDRDPPAGGPGVGASDDRRQRAHRPSRPPARRARPVAVLAVLLVALVAPRGVRAADPITFGTPARDPDLRRADRRSPSTRRPMRPSRGSSCG